MAARTRNQFVQDAVAAYASAHSSRPDEVQLALQDATRKRTGPAAGMQIDNSYRVQIQKKKKNIYIYIL